MRFAKRQANLGTETAFFIAENAKSCEDRGQQVCHFHLGDINIKTPRNIREAIASAIMNGSTKYGPSAGLPELRHALANEVGKRRALELSDANVSIQPGGKIVIPKFIQTFMDPGDIVLYPNPGYPIYESAINYFGGIARPYCIEETETGFKINLDNLEQKAKGARILIYNNYQNPTAAASTAEEMNAIAEISKKNDLVLLSDEAYESILYEEQFRSISSLPDMFERTVILYTFSKKYAMTGIRVGAAISPREATEHFNKLNTNYESCTATAAQIGALEALIGPQNRAQENLRILKERRDAFYDNVNNIRGFRAHKPTCTFYGYAEVTEAIKRTKAQDYETFWKLILAETGVAFCPRNYFGTPLKNEKRHYVRFAFSNMDKTQIEEGLSKLQSFMERH